MVLRGHDFQQLQNPDHSSPVEEEWAGKTPSATSNCGYLKKVDTSVPVPSRIIIKRILGNKVCETPFLLKLVSCAINSLYKSSLILLQQFIPFFILCLDIIGNPEHDEIETDFALVSWINDRVEGVVDERVELRPVMIIMKAMITACNQVARNRLADSTSSHSFQAP